MLALAAVPAAGGVPSVGPASPVPLIAAHRGGSGSRPESSLAAYRAAAALPGVDFLECDVQLTKDRAAVVIHDPTLERTTTGRGLVRGLSLAELKRLRLKDGRGRTTEERIPTLDEVAAVAASGGKGLLVEIKDGTPGAEKEALAILSSRGLTQKSVIMAFEPETLGRVRALDPRVRTAVLCSFRSLWDRGVLPAAAIQEAVRDKAQMIVFEQTWLISADAVAAALAAGLAVGAYTVDDSARAGILAGWGVTLLISDDPSALSGTIIPHRGP